MLSLIPALCLMLFTSTQPTIKLTSDSLTLPWATDLPEPLILTNGNTCLPPALATEIGRHLEWEAALPGLCVQAVEDETARVKPVCASRLTPFLLGAFAGLVTGLVLHTVR